MEYIRAEEIESAFSHEYRHYLTGHLSRAQLFLKHIDDDIEVGMSDYKDFTADVPHVHPVATEHGYVLKGAVRIRSFEPEGMEETEYHEGDFFVIRPGVSHASKNAAGTRILFIKSPGINDKTVIPVDEDTQNWLKKW